MGKTWIIGMLGAITAVLMLNGCNNSSPREGAAASSPAEPEVASADAKVFQVKGVVRKVPETGATVVIHHEEIPDYMVEMTMPFVLKDEAEKAGLKAGDAVVFEYHVTEEGAWIENLQPQAPASGSEP